MSRPYNILLLNETSGPGGAETVIFNIAKNLDRNQYTPRVGLFCDGWFAEHLAHHGIAVDIIQSKKSWDLTFLKDLMNYCSANKIDLIHAHLPGANLYGSVAGKMLGIPVICTLHNEMIIAGYVERFGSIKRRIIRSLATRYVVVAKYMQQDYIVKGKFSPRKMVTIYNGLSDSDGQSTFDLDAFKRDIDFHEGEILITNVANFRPPKGHRVLIEAAHLVHQAAPNVKFLLIGDEGDGSIIGYVRDRIKEWGLADNVKLLGFRKDVYHILRNSDIFLLASNSEGLPISVVEAMLASKTVVATDVGGLSEIVVSGKTGFLVEPNNPKAIADTLLNLVNNAKLRSEIGDQGHQYALATLSIKSMIDQYQKLYRELIVG
jgi:glycosyltransferase involved in cell wall biosynthesis